MLELEEYKSVSDFSENTIEAEVILVKDLGKADFPDNPILEFEHEDEWVRDSDDDTYHGGWSRTSECY